MTTPPFPRIAIIAAYLGRLPDYFPVFLTSCAYNPDFDWLIFTDAAADAYTLPPNVQLRPLSLALCNAAMSEALGMTTQILKPYKICDFKPIYWALLRDEPVAYDFWGHCDLDIVFGDLRRIVTPDLLARHDKIFSVGHLTLYRNTAEVNRMGLKPHPTVDWRAILGRPQHFGFDEHYGVNLVWKAEQGRYFEDESLVADIDPAIGRFERVAPYRNYRDQAFVFDRGHIYRDYVWLGRRRREEFLYIHIPRRRFSALPEGDRFYIGPTGFVPAGEAPATRRRLQEVNPYAFRAADSVHRLRTRFRTFRRGLRAAWAGA